MIKMSASIKIENSCVRVSSVLNRDTKQFGKKYLFDGDDDTCWNSDQGSPQWVQVVFPTPVSLEAVHIQFQGGFAGRECWLEGKPSTGKGSEFTKLEEFYPEDINSLQIFKTTSTDELQAVKVVFNNSTDFFGRITIYKMELFARPG